MPTGSFGEPQFERLATISVSHLCRLRKTLHYRQQRLTVTKTQHNTDNKGRRTKHYPYELMATPYEKFLSLPEWQTYLKPGMSCEALL